MEREFVMFLGASLVIYIILIFILGFFITSIDYSLNRTTNNLTGENEIAFGDKVSVSVTRPRIYGEIISNEKQTKLYLFRLLPIPLKFKSFNLVYLHLLFILFVTSAYFWYWY